MKKVFKLLIIYLFIILNFQCSPDKAENIFLITLDTTRNDFINYDSGKNEETPNLAKIAKKGFFFKNAFSLIPITLPSHASMFYSLYPHDLNLLNNGNINRAKHISLAQILKKKGFGTYAVISLGVLKSEFGLNRGFDEFFDKFKPFLWTRNAEDVNAIAFKMIRNRKRTKNFFWIHYSDPHEPYFPPSQKGQLEILHDNKKLVRTNPHLVSSIKKRFIIKPGRSILKFITKIPPEEIRRPKYLFNYITLKDFKISPDDPSSLKVTYPETLSNRGRESVDFYTTELISEIILKNSSKKEISAELSFIYTLHVKNSGKKGLYRSSVKYMDSKIGELINFLKENSLYERSAFIITGDHGEGLGDYMEHWGHIHYLNEPYSRIPFIVTGFGIPAEGEREEVVSNLNVAPTILELAGIKAPKFMLGESTLKKIKKQRLILETFSPEAYFDAFSLIEYPYQIIFYPGRRENRIEFHNIFKKGNSLIKSISEGEKKIRKNMLKSILDISRTITATKGKAGGRKRLHREILRSLGYL